MNWKETYTEWMHEASMPNHLKVELEKKREDEDWQKDAFYDYLPFGTAGMRGIIGAGTNRMNIYTIRYATEGLAQWIISQGEDAKKRGVAIAYDSRHFSKEFALEAAKILAYHEISSYLFEDLRPTPELSFSVRYHKAIAGIMITASHNPPQYNGYKLYGSDGGQLPPEAAEHIIHYMKKIKNPLKIHTLMQDQSPYIHIVGSEVDQAYLNALKTVNLDQNLLNSYADQVKIVFTSLHGTGHVIGEVALKQAGFTDINLVTEQCVPDPDFKTVSSPNPEEKEAFEEAIVLGEKVNADILLATDPDADRLGLAVKSASGDYKVLTGNQIAALITQYLVNYYHKHATLPKNSVIIKSIVSSELPAQIAKSKLIKTMNVLTGFKYIAEKINEFEHTREHHFLFGFEESYGYLLKPFVRDKDAIQAMLILAEITAYYKQQNLSILDALDDIYKEYGYYLEKTLSFTFEGLSGMEQMKQIMYQLRHHPLEHIHEIPVIRFEDYHIGEFVDYLGNTGVLVYPKADVLKYMLKDETWIAIRPSGTEPKIKIYIGVRGETKEEAEKRLLAYSDFVQTLL